MGKAKHQRAAAAGDQQAIKASIQEAPASAQPAAELAVWAINDEVELKREYSDMKDIPDENGLPNAGYLVLKKGEVVRILYIGSDKTEDTGWLYGEVTKSLPAKNAGRRGWLPTTAAEPPPRVPPSAVSAKPSQARAATPATSTTRPSQPMPAASATSATNPTKARLGTARPSQATPAPSGGYVASAPSSSRAVVPERRNGGRAAVNMAVSASEGRRGEAFPALPGSSGEVPAWWAEEDEVEVTPAPPKRQVSGRAAPRDVEGTIARQRAAAAAAAAKAEAKTPKCKGAKAAADEGASSCPICVEPFSAQRRYAQLPCCGVEMCAVCAEKSLRSKKCYFCREEAPEFPALV